MVLLTAASSRIRLRVGVCALTAQKMLAKRARLALSPPPSLLSSTLLLAVVVQGYMNDGRLCAWTKCVLEKRAPGMECALGSFLGSTEDVRISLLRTGEGGTGERERIGCGSGAGGGGGGRRVLG